MNFFTFLFISFCTVIVVRYYIKKSKEKIGDQNDDYTKKNV